MAGMIELFMPVPASFEELSEEKRTRTTKVWKDAKKIAFLWDWCPMYVFLLVAVVFPVFDFAGIFSGVAWLPIFWITTCPLTKAIVFKKCDSLFQRIKKEISSFPDIQEEVGKVRHVLKEIKTFTERKWFRWLF